MEYFCFFENFNYDSLVLTDFSTTTENLILSQMSDEVNP